MEYVVIALLRGEVTHGTAHAPPTSRPRGNPSEYCLAMLGEYIRSYFVRVRKVSESKVNLRSIIAQQAPEYPISNHMIFPAFHSLNPIKGIINPHSITVYFLGSNRLTLLFLPKYCDVSPNGRPSNESYKSK